MSLTPSHEHGQSRFDAACRRRVLRNGGPRPHRYVETVEARPGARVFARGVTRAAPVELDLSFGDHTDYRVEGAYHRTLADQRGTRALGAPPFESFGLLNRYHSEHARLELRGLGNVARGTFASATDLGTGEERPLGIERGEADHVVVQVRDCAPRTLLRVYWPLA